MRASLVAAVLAARVLAETVAITLVSGNTLSRTSPTYASWNIDPSCNRGFHHIDFSNPNLLAAAVGLHPSRLRFGGSGADGLTYGLSPGSPECANVRPVGCDYVTPGCLNATTWDALFTLANASRTDFIFGVSIGLADACAQGPAYVWNASNAAVLLEYLRVHNQAVWGFEVGNEVNNNGGAPCNLTAAQQAKAITAFAMAVQAQLPRAVIVGPDTGGRYPETWLTALLPLLRPRQLYGVTHHVYNGVNRANFNSAARLDNSLPEIAWYTNIVRTLAPSSEIWSGENGPTGGGDDGTCGADTVCGTYASSLWYSDDMAQRAKHGFVQYQRQDLFGGAYGLTNSLTGAMALQHDDALSIRPDYWVAFLWKRTLGTFVLNASSSSADVRAYAFRGAPPSEYAAATYCGNGDAPQLLLLHLGNVTSASAAVPSVDGYPNIASWTLAPTATGGPFGTDATLNGGDPLPATIDVRVTNPASFLSMIPRPATIGVSSAALTLPPLSISFVCYFQ